MTYYHVLYAYDCNGYDWEVFATEQEALAFINETAARLKGENPRFTLIEGRVQKLVERTTVTEYASQGADREFRPAP